MTVTTSMHLRSALRHTAPKPLPAVAALTLLSNARIPPTPAFASPQEDQNVSHSLNSVMLPWTTDSLSCQGRGNSHMKLVGPLFPNYLPHKKHTVVSIH